jgi:hypothetical protein
LLTFLKPIVFIKTLAEVKLAMNVNY